MHPRASTSRLISLLVRALAAAAISFFLLMLLLAVSENEAEAQEQEHIVSAGQTREFPILAATADCVADGETQELIRYRVKNVDGVHHNAEVLFDGVVKTSFRIGSEPVTGTIEVDFDSANHPELVVRYTDITVEGNSSLPIKIRPNRCFKRNQPNDPATEFRANGPVGYVGLECHNGVRKISYDLENIYQFDPVRRPVNETLRMSLNVYSAGAGSQDDVEVVPRAFIPDGNRLTGLVDHPYLLDADGSVYTGQTLIRGWYRFSGEQLADVPGNPPLVLDKNAHHSRTWYQTTPECQSAPADLIRPARVDGLRFVSQAGSNATISWEESTDNVGVTSYTVLRNLIPVLETSSTIAQVELRAGGNYFQVVANDAAGNRSPRQSPLDPSSPTNLAVVVNADATLNVTWAASTAPTGAVEYRVLRNLVEVARVTTTEATVDVGEGIHFIQVQAIDTGLGAESPKTEPVRVLADITRPSAPTGLQVDVNADGTLSVSWEASRDNVGVQGYKVSRNNVQIGDLVEATSTNLPLGSGTHYIQVRATDFAGNDGAKTLPVMVTVP